MIMDKCLVLDANILIRAVLGQKVRHVLFDFAGIVSFVTPQTCIDDACKYLPSLLEERGFAEPQQSMLLLQELVKIIQVVDELLLEDYQAIAKKLLRQRDVEDWPILATALLFNSPIWTEDKDFFGVGVATWTTANIRMFLEG